MKKLIEIKHYKDLALPSSPEPNSVYYILDQSTNKVKTFITDKSGFPIPLVDLTGGSGGNILSVTGTGVTGTTENPKIDIATFISQQIGNRVYLSTQDGKLTVNPITSPNNTISVTSTTNELQLKIADAIVNKINSALQSGDNISSLTNNVGYITLADIPTFDPSNYDLSQFDNLSSDPFVRNSQIGGELATVATTGNYNDLLNIPTTFTPSAHTHPISQVVDLQSTLDGKEDTSNKQNSLTVDGTGNKYPTVDAINTAGFITNVNTSLGYIPANRAGDIFTGNITAPNLMGINTGDETLASIQAKLVSTTNLPEGTNLYFTTSRVLSTLLSGLSLVTGGVIAATDSVLVAFGKLQKQITDLTTTVSSNTTAIAGKQDTLVSGTNIKTINSTSLLGSGNIIIPALYSVRIFYLSLNLAIVNTWYSFTRNTTNMLINPPTNTYGTGTVPVDSSGTVLADVNYLLVSGVNRLKRVSFSSRESVTSINMELFIKKFDLVEGNNGRGGEAFHQILVQETFTTAGGGSFGTVKTNFTIASHTLTSISGIQIAFRSTSGTSNAQGINLVLDFE